MDLKARAALRKAYQRRPEVPSVQDMINHTEDFGIKGYQISKFNGKAASLYRPKYEQSTMVKGTKKESFLYEQAMKRKDAPAPTRYSPRSTSETRRIFHKLYGSERRTGFA